MLSVLGSGLTERGIKVTGFQVEGLAAGVVCSLVYLQMYEADGTTHPSSAPSSSPAFRFLNARRRSFLSAAEFARVRVGAASDIVNVVSVYKESSCWMGAVADEQGIVVSKAKLEEDVGEEGCAGFRLSRDAPIFLASQSIF